MAVVYIVAVTVASGVPNAGSHGHCRDDAVEQADANQPTTDPCLNRSGSRRDSVFVSARMKDP